MLTLQKYVCACKFFFWLWFALFNTMTIATLSPFVWFTYSIYWIQKLFDVSLWWTFWLGIDCNRFLQLYFQFEKHIFGFGGDILCIAHFASKNSIQSLIIFIKQRNNTHSVVKCIECNFCLFAVFRVFGISHWMQQNNKILMRMESRLNWLLALYSNLHHFSVCCCCWFFLSWTRRAKAKV